MYLRIATEIPLKKLLVGGLERVYELGRLFRNEGVDSRHNPEFTTVELYQAYGDLRDMMELTETLLVTLAQELRGTTKLPYRRKEVDVSLRVDLGNGKKGWPRLDYCELLKQHASVAFDDEPGLDAKLKEKGLDPKGLSLVDKIDGVFGEYCEPHLWDACFVINQPVEMSPLCKAHPQNPKLADRFEAFAGEMEIANAYSELNDAREQRRRLVAQPRGFWLKALGDIQALHMPAVMRMGVDKLAAEIHGAPDWNASEEHREAVRRLLTSDDPEVKAVILKHRENLARLLDPESAVDEDFLNALDHGMPPAGGLGIGIDRIMMLLTSNDSIRDVIPFPFMRPETAGTSS
jgi:lysyl-tRNA synthetase class II